MPPMPPLMSTLYNLNPNQSEVVRLPASPRDEDRSGPSAEGSRLRHSMRRSRERRDGCYMRKTLLEIGQSPSNRLPPLMGSQVGE